MGAFGGAFGQLVIPSNQFLIKFLNEDLVSIAAGDTLSNPVILKRYTLTPNPAEAVPQVVSMSDFFLWAIGRRISGAGIMRFAFLRSIDNGVNWTNITTVGISTAGFTAGSSDAHRNGILNDTTDLAVAVHNNDGISTGEFKNMKVTVALDIPLLMKVAEV